MQLEKKEKEESTQKIIEIIRRNLAGHRSMLASWPTTNAKHRESEFKYGECMAWRSREKVSQRGAALSGPRPTRSRGGSGPPPLG
jgi:hypothetical protein